MKNIWVSLSLCLNLIFIIALFNFNSRNTTLENLNREYYTHYVPKERCDKLRDKVSDYEWILQNVIKVENVDVMRRNWCNR